MQDVRYTGRRASSGRRALTTAALAAVCLGCAFTRAEGGTMPVHETFPSVRIEGVCAGAPVERLATGFRFTEGPVWIAEGGYLLFSDIPADTIHKWSPAGGAGPWRRPSDNSNGLTRDLEGRLLACEHGSRTVTRAALGEVKVAVAARYLGKRFNSPNDAVVKSDGAIYFTDPPYGLRRGDVRELDVEGVYRIDPKTGSVDRVAFGFEKPNGLAFSPDESILYVASSDRASRLVRAYDVLPDGGLARERVFCDCSNDGNGAPDGIKVDVAGRLYVSCNGVWVFSPDGVYLGEIPVPESVANIAWGDPDWKGLYITARTSLYRVRLETPGIPVPPVRARPAPGGG